MVDMKDRAELPIDYILVQTILRSPRSDVSIAADLSRLLVGEREYQMGTGNRIVIVVIDFWVFEVDWNSHCSKRGTDRWTESVVDLDS
jgi:hypothetical protein